MTIKIQVQSLNVTITVGDGSPPKAPTSPVVAQSSLREKAVKAPGGAGVGEETVTGGNTPGSGVVVIGPIVIDGCAAGTADQSRGGVGGAGVGEETVTGGNTPGSGVAVIGPIVVT